MTVLKFWRVHPNVKLPKHQTEGSACFDLAFQGYGKFKVTGFNRMNKPVERLLEQSMTISPGDRMMVPTGLVMDIPKGYSVRLHARSGMSLKQGLILANAEGVVDSDYVQEVMVLVHNISSNQIVIQTGDRIAQAELVEDVKYSIAETPARPGVKTNRTGGMGSTGISLNGNSIVIKVAEPNPAIPQKKITKAPVKKVATKKPVRTKKKV